MSLNYGSKGALQSKGVMGSIAGIVIGITATLVHVGVEEAQEIPEVMLAIGGAVSAAISLYGRIKANKKISGLLK